MANSNLKARLAALEHKVPAPGVGILVRLENGWEASRDGGKVIFRTENKARIFLNGCRTIILVDI